MTRIEKYGIFCRSWEGGWSNHPNDKGGATMRGNCNGHDNHVEPDKTEEDDDA